MATRDPVSPKRSSSMRTLFEVRAHRRTWRVVVLLLGFLASWLATRHLIE